MYKKGPSLNNKSVLHVTTGHHFKDTRILYKECVTLSNAGYDVAILAPGKKQEAVCNVEHIPLGTSNTKLLFRCTVGLFLVLVGIIRRSSAIVHLHDPELLLIGGICRLLGFKVIFDSHEDYGRAVYSKHYLSKFWAKIIYYCIILLEKFSGLVLNGFVVVDQNIARNFPIHKTVVIHNYPLQEEWKLVEVENDNRQNLIYLGSINENRGFFEMITLIGDLPVSLNQRLFIAGNIPQKLKAEAKNMKGWSRVVELGYLSRQQIKEILPTIKIGLCLLSPTDAYKDAKPVKVFEYIAGGLRVVLSDFPEWRATFQDSKVCYFVSPSNQDQIYSTCVEVLNKKGNVSNNKFLEKYSWDNEALRLIGFYSSL